MIKPISDKCIASIIFNGEKLKSFPLRSRMRQRYLLLPLLINILLEVLTRESMKEKETKNNQTKKKKKTKQNKKKHLSLFAGNMILYIENLKDNTKTNKQTNKQKNWQNY